MAGVPHQSVFQKIASEFSEIHFNGAQLRRYESIVSTLPMISFVLKEFVVFKKKSYKSI